jgi:excisionase family DNA binding protein
MPWGAFVRSKKNASLGYTAKELAEAFGLCRDTIYRMTRAKKLPHIRLSSGAIRYPKQAIRAMLTTGHAVKLE